MGDRGKVFPGSTSSLLESHSDSPPLFMPTADWGLGILPSGCSIHTCLDFNRGPKILYSMGAGKIALQPSLFWILPEDSLSDPFRFYHRTEMLWGKNMVFTYFHLHLVEQGQASGQSFMGFPTPGRALLLSWSLGWEVPTHPSRSSPTPHYHMKPWLITSSGEVGLSLKPWHHTIALTILLYVVCCHFIYFSPTRSKQCKSLKSFIAVP